VSGEPRTLSVIMPALNEAARIGDCLAALQPLRAAGHELIVVDGGSDDGTAALARAAADRVLAAPRGRAAQMNAGARLARGEALIFVHADTRLPPHADALVIGALARSAWGRFDVSIDSPRPLLRLVAAMMNLRSRVTGIATGDQAIFVRRALFEEQRGYAPIPLMEDVELSRRLRRVGAPACLRAWVWTSARRWEARGVLRTIALMWHLRLAFWLGADPARLAERYR
jgi:rSAM/selenodomain-associated transferase 2